MALSQMRIRLVPGSQAVRVDELIRGQFVAECLGGQCTFSLIHDCAVWGQCLWVEGLSSCLCSDKNVSLIKILLAEWKPTESVPRVNLLYDVSGQDEKM